MPKHLPIPSCPKAPQGFDTHYGRLVYSYIFSRYEVENFYKILGFTWRTHGEFTDIPQAEIKRQYHKLLLEFHPDKNPGDKKAEERTKDILDAYKMINTKKKRTKLHRQTRDATYGWQNEKLAIAEERLESLYLFYNALEALVGAETLEKDPLWKALTDNNWAMHYLAAHYDDYLPTEYNASGYEGMRLKPDEYVKIDIAELQTLHDESPELFSLFYQLPDLFNSQTVWSDFYALNTGEATEDGNPIKEPVMNPLKVMQLFKQKRHTIKERLPAIEGFGIHYEFYLFLWENFHLHNSRFWNKDDYIDGVPIFDIYKKNKLADWRWKILKMSFDDQMELWKKCYDKEKKTRNVIKDFRGYIEGHGYVSISDLFDQISYLAEICCDDTPTGKYLLNLHRYVLNPINIQQRKLRDQGDHAKADQLQLAKNEIGQKMFQAVSEDVINPKNTDLIINGLSKAVGGVLEKYAKDEIILNRKNPVADFFRGLAAVFLSLFVLGSLLLESDYRHRFFSTATRRSLADAERTLEELTYFENERRYQFP